MSPIISKDVWITKEGRQMNVQSMASSHLLSAIHFIERSRFTNSLECYNQDSLNHPDKMAMVEYYLAWPIQYDTMIAEAQRRGLINRGVEGLVKRNDR